MAEFAYKNIKNMRTGHNSFKLNYGYYLRISYKKDVILGSKSNLAEKLLSEVRELIIIY